MDYKEHKCMITEEKNGRVDCGEHDKPSAVSTKCNIVAIYDGSHSHILMGSSLQISNY